MRNSSGSNFGGGDMEYPYQILRHFPAAIYVPKLAIGCSFNFYMLASTARMLTTEQRETFSTTKKKASFVSRSRDALCARGDFAVISLLNTSNGTTWQRLWIISFCDLL